MPTGCCPKKGGATLLLQYHLFTISWNYIALKTASHNFGWWIGQCQSFPEATAHVNPKASVFHPKKHLASKLSWFWVIQPSVTQKRGKKKVFSTWFNHILYPLSNHGIPSGKLTWLWKITIFNGKFHYKWLFSIAMLNYQRVSPPRRDRNDRNRGACAWAAHRCARRARRRRQPCTRGTLNCRLTWRRWLRSAVKALGGPKG